MNAKLILHTLSSKTISVRTAPSTRQWMDDTPHRFAYRCLPLKIANAHGWEILNDRPFTAMWDGTADKTGIIIESDDGSIPTAITHFGSGVLTFHIDCLFQTDPGISLLVQGPVNSPKDGIQALSGIIETDWSPMTFTMNWVFTRPNVCIRFEKNEPICSFFPTSLEYIKSVKPAIKNIKLDTKLSEEYSAFTKSRNEFNNSLNNKSVANKPWQKHYHNGESTTGNLKAGKNHITKLILNGFSDDS